MHGKGDPMYFVIRRSAGGQYWFRIVGNNHETMAHSELYTTKASAESSIATIRREAAGAGTLESIDNTTERDNW